MNKKNIIIIFIIIILILGIFFIKKVITNKKKNNTDLALNESMKNVEENAQTNNTENIANNVLQNEVENVVQNENLNNNVPKNEVNVKKETETEVTQNTVKETNTKNEETNTNQTQAPVEPVKTEKEKYILYDFGSDDCYYCTVIEPIFNKYKNSYDNITFKAIDIYTDTTLTNKYKVQYTPTFIMIDSKGNEIERRVGAMQESEFKNFVEKYI